MEKLIGSKHAESSNSEKFRDVRLVYATIGSLRRDAECLTHQTEKRLVVERLDDKGKGPAFKRSGAPPSSVLSGTYNRDGTG